MLRANAFLLHHQPDGTLQEYPLLGEQVLLGRAETCDITVIGRLISRQHARIQATAHGYTIEDLGSRNGTLINGQLLAGRHLLHDGDQIELGGMGMLRFVDSDATGTRQQAPARGIWLEQATHDVWVDGHCLSPQVSSVQFALLKHLHEHLDQICSRNEIIAVVWPEAHGGISDEALDALIKRVRARLSEVAQGQRYLGTIRGRGLMLYSPEKSTKR